MSSAKGTFAWSFMFMIIRTHMLIKLNRHLVLFKHFLGNYVLLDPYKKYFAYVYIYNNVLGSTSSTHLPMQWVPLSASTAFSNFPFLMGRIWHNFSLNNIKLPSTQCTQEAQKVQDKYGEVPMMELDEHWWDGILQ